MEAAAHPGPDALSIGDLSVACGISPHTLRVWERRYGRPAARRLPSGHRRYASSDVAWLRQVHELIAYGHRPGGLLTLPAEEIGALTRRERGQRQGDPRIASWLEDFRNSGPVLLRRRVASVLQELGPERAVAQGIASFVEQVGLQWQEGQLSIAEEHAITEVLEDLLRAERQTWEGGLPPARPDLVLAAASGERHGLGLQMAALVATAAGARTLLLGVDLPIGEIALAAARHEARAAGLSVSLAHSGSEAGRQVQELRDLLPAGVELLVGGLGARAACRGVPSATVVARLEELGAWARAGAEARQP